MTCPGADNHLVLEHIWFVSFSRPTARAAWQSELVAGRCIAGNVRNASRASGWINCEAKKPDEWSTRASMVSTVLIVSSEARIDAPWGGVRDRVGLENIPLRLSGARVWRLLLSYGIRYHQN